MKHVNSATPLILLLSIECTLFAQTAGVGVGDCAGSKAVGCVLPNIYNGNKGVTLPPGQPGEHIAHFLEASGYTENFLPLNKAIATQLALLEAMWVCCPKLEKGEEMMRCETPLLAIEATS